MSDAVDYFRAHAVRALCKARTMSFGRGKRTQRAIARIYHLLTKEAALGPNLAHLDDFRQARSMERRIENQSKQTKPRASTPIASRPR